MDKYNFSNSENFGKSESRIDFKRVLYRATRYWYFVFASIAICLVIAFINNRYTQRVYPVAASIIIRETEETAGAAEILYKNNLVDPYRNYLNELYIIKSYPLIESVIQDLGFTTQFQRVGNVLTSELYGDSTFKATVINKNKLNQFSAKFKAIDDNRFELRSLNEENEIVKIFDFGDTIEFGGLTAIFAKNPKTPANQFKGENIIFSYSSPRAIAASYVGRLSATWAEKGAGVINLSIVGNYPQKEIDFLNGLIRRYQEYDLSRKNLAATRAIKFISLQLVDISDSLRKVERRLERFKATHSISDGESEASRVLSKLEEVESQKIELSLKERYNKYIIDYISNGKDLDQVILPSSVGLSDGILGTLLTEMIRVQSELRRLESKDILINPIVRERKDRLTELKNSVIEAIKNQQSADGIKLEFINAQIKASERKLDYLPAQQQQFISINRSYTLLENLYVFLLQKRAEAGISTASSVSDVEVVNDPIAGGAIYPKPKENLILAGTLGLAIPLLIFILLEYLNIKIQSKEEIEKITSIPFIGGIGHKNTDDNLAVKSAPKSQLAESFRALRSNLSYFVKGKGNVTLLVTSSISGEGKTFTSINLATVLAFSGKKTLIVGADMRRPKIFGDFNLPNTLGLSSYLAGLNSFDEVVQKTNIDFLDIVSAGPIPPNPSELILGALTDQFFEQAKKDYDYVIVDTPPLAIVSDAFVLANHCNHVLFIARQNYTPKHMIKSVHEFYQSGRISNMSILLNDIYKSGIGYGYGYESSYGYGFGYGSIKNGYGYYAD